MHVRQCETCAVRHKALCGALSAEEINRLNAIAIQKRVPAGKVILSDQETQDYFANVISGVVKLSKTLADGRQQIVGLQFPSDFLGRPFGTRIAYDAQAATDVQLCTFSKSQFERLIKEIPGIEHRLFAHTLDELDAAREWMLLLGRKSAREKVASLLLMIARRSLAVGCTPHADGATVAFELPLSRNEIADYLGLTIETVSRQLTALKNADVITLPSLREVRVPDIGALERAAEEGSQA